MVHTIREADDAQRGFDMLATLRLIEIGQQQWQLDILERGQHRNQVVELKDEPDMTRAPARHVTLLHSGNFLATDRDSPGRGMVDTGDQVQHRGLARSRGPHYRDEAPGRNLHGDIVERADFELVALVDSGHVLEIDCVFFIHNRFCPLFYPARPRRFTFLSARTDLTERTDLCETTCPLTTGLDRDWTRRLTCVSRFNCAQSLFSTPAFAAVIAHPSSTIILRTGLAPLRRISVTMRARIADRSSSSRCVRSICSNAISGS